MSRRVRILLGLGASALWLAAPAESGEPRPAALGAGRAVIAPMNLGVRAVPEVEPGLDPVWRALLQYFATEAGPAIALDRESATSLWGEVMADARAAGEGKDLYAAYARFAKRIAEQTQFETIVFPNLVLHPARLNGGSDASWDGVHRLVGIPGPMIEGIDAYREGKIWIERHGASGELAAASLHLVVFSSKGERRYEGRGGLVLLQEIAAPPHSDGGDLKAVMRKDPFAAPDQLDEGIRAAFRE